jgi:hypothetical protein
VLANAQKISVVRTATIQVSVNNERHKINVYILTNLSNPLIKIPVVGEIYWPEVAL